MRNFSTNLTINGKTYHVEFLFMWMEKVCEYEYTATITFGKTYQIRIGQDGASWKFRQQELPKMLFEYEALFIHAIQSQNHLSSVPGK